MTVEEIRQMIEYYGMSRAGDKIRMTKHLDETKKNIEAIKAAKPEIMAYWDAEYKAQQEEWKRRQERFLSIPGVREIMAAQRAWEDYHEEFNRAMDEGNGRVPASPDVSINELVAKFPDGAFAVKVYDETLSHNYEISAYANRAYDALRDGKPVSEVREAYEKEKAAFVERHMWD